MVMIYQEGIDAYRKGIRFDECPYQTTDSRYKQWQSGWLGEDLVNRRHPPVKKVPYRSNTIFRI